MVGFLSSSGGHKSLPIIVTGILIGAVLIGGVTVLEQQGVIQNTTTIFSTASTGTRHYVQNTITSGKQGVLAVRLTDPPNAPGGVTGIVLAYSDIQVHNAAISNTSEGWYTIANSGSVDLMKLRKVSVTLGSGIVDAGKFDLVRFDVNSAIITYNGENYSAIVPENRISLSVSAGGITVNDSGSAGLLIDLSPTVLPFQTSGGSLGFVLVPSAICLPVPSPSWDTSYEQEGQQTVLSNETWFEQTQNQTSGSIEIVNATLTNNSFSLEILNNGETNVTLNSVSIFQDQSALNSASFDNSSLSSTISFSTSKTVESSTVSSDSSSGNNDTTTLDNGTVFEATSSSNSSDYFDASSQNTSDLVTISSFQVLSNGSMISSAQFEQAGGNLSTGMILSPNDTVVLTYTGDIATQCVGDFTGSSPTCTTTINPGNAFVVGAFGDVEATAYTNVTSS